MQRPAKPFTPVRFRLQPPNIMKVAIIGFGFVGKALRNGLKDDVDCIEVDPKLGTNINDLINHKLNVGLCIVDVNIVISMQSVCTLCCEIKIHCKMKKIVSRCVSPKSRKMSTPSTVRFHFFQKYFSIAGW